jgi:LacI family transcriptional regulator, galactose operon repressor
MSAKRATSQDVARLAGVSRTTVSVVLNNVQGINISPATRQRVIEAARSLGYVPDAAAQALVSGRVRIIGLILARYSYHISSDAFILQILEGLFDTIHSNDLRLIVDIVNPEHQEQAYLQLVRAKRIDGILLSGPLVDDRALKALEEINFPTVIVGQIAKTTLCYVDVDNCAAAYKAVTHLVRLGHTRIACITNAPPSYTAAVDRLRGYQQALADHQIAFEPTLVRYGDFTIESGYREMASLIEKQWPFSAVFVASDTLALGANAAIQERGYKVPADISLIGFDDLPMARFMEPALTTVHLPIKRLASEACELLIKLMNGENLNCSNIILDVDLVIRDSCGSGDKVI